jgi:hypothetical protein
MWHPYSITSQCCQARHQRRGQVLIEKKSHAGVMRPFHAQGQGVSADALEADSCERELRRTPGRGCSEKDSPVGSPPR